jgi:hypothetical protein
MKILAAALLVATLATTAAPADRYFGKLKMSALRIRYEAMQLRVRYETHKLRPEDAEHLLLLTEDAFDSWSHAYPKDGWLASTAYLMAGLYQELPGGNAAHHATTLYSYVVHQFPNTHYASQSRTALHRGIPVRSYPAWAVTPVPATPSASASAPAASPGASPAPAAPAASPSPAAT